MRNTFRARQQHLTFAQLPAEIIGFQSAGNGMPHRHQQAFQTGIESLQGMHHADTDKCDQTAADFQGHRQYALV